MLSDNEQYNITAHESSASFKDSRLPGSTYYMLNPPYICSPDGFCWGYGGSGPTDTAIAIIADYLCTTAMAVVSNFTGTGSIADFRTFFVASLADEQNTRKTQWIIFGETIYQWIELYAPDWFTMSRGRADEKTQTYTRIQS